MHRARWSAVLVVAAGLVVACTQGGGEKTDSTRAAIHGGSSDPNGLNSNVVVKLRKQVGPLSLRGTGVLITPTLVLTANHNITGSVGKDSGMGNDPEISVGAFITLPVDPLRIPANHVSGQISANSEGDTAEDVSLVYLDASELDKPSFRYVLEQTIARPSLAIPPSSVSGSSCSMAQSGGSRASTPSQPSLRRRSSTSEGTLSFGLIRPPQA